MLTLHIKQKNEATPICTHTVRHDNLRIGLHCSGMSRCYTRFFVASFKVDVIAAHMRDVRRYLLMGLKAAAILFLCRWSALASVLSDATSSQRLLMKWTLSQPGHITAATLDTVC